MSLDRRTFIEHSRTAASGLPRGACFAARTSVDGLTVLDMQLGWLAGGNQLGEVVAKRLGYLEEVSAAQAMRLPAVMKALGSEDAEEGVRAFREKRPPNWSGK